MDDKNLLELKKSTLSKNSSGKVRLTVDVSPELNEALNSLAKNSSTTKSDVLRKAITLMEVLTQARERGEKITIVDQNESTKTEIVGI